MVGDGSLKSSLDSFEILTARWTDLEEARKTILKSRQDIITQIGGGATIISAIYHATKQQESQTSPPNQLLYGIWSISPPSLGEPRLRIQQLLEHTIPGALLTISNDSHGGKHVSFGPRNTTVFIKQSEGLLIYNLAGLVPQRIGFLKHNITGHHDIQPITSDYVLTSFSDSLRLVDITYQTVQAIVDLNQAKQKRKRFRSTESTIGPIEFIGYFPQFGRCLAKRRKHLLAIDIKFGSSTSSTEPQGKKSLLIHNIGQGRQLVDIPVDSTASKVRREKKINIGYIDDTLEKSAHWQQTRKRLDQRFEAGDIAGFESAIFEDINNSTGEQTSLKPEKTHYSDFKIDYLLSKLFQVGQIAKENDARILSIRLALPVRKVLQWLSMTGALNTGRVQRALHNCGSLGQAHQIGLDSIAQALIDYDSSLSFLTEDLERNTQPNVDEQVAIVKLLIRDAMNGNRPSETEGPKLLAENLHSVNAPAKESVNGFAVNSQSDSQAGADSLSPALAKALILAVNTLGSNSSNRISSCLRNQLSQTEVLALIQFLRQQLFQGGHTRSMQTISDSSNHIFDESAEPVVDGLVNFDAIVRIMSSCVDLIGPLGLVGLEDDEHFVESIVPELVSEISRALQFVEETTELQGILRETLRYHESLFRHSGTKTSRPIGDVDNFGQQTGRIVNLYSESTEDGDVNVTGALPLSLGADNVVSPLKVRKGGAQVTKRSNREILIMESRQKGSYSFDRLIL